ncbi:MAG: hypothetical protein J6R23_00240 [Spirochaetales bacterium]|nr:hypothetical protein [Spirochaetales bacterium]
MKKITLLLISLLLATSLFAAELQHTAGGAVGIYMNLGDVLLQDSGKQELLATLGIAAGPVYDLTVKTDSVLAYGARARADFLISNGEKYNFYEMDLFAGPKGTVNLFGRARLNLAIGATLGYSDYNNFKTSEEKISKTFSWGVGTDVYVDVDITDNFGMGLGYLGKINFDFKHAPNKDDCLLLSSDIYLSGYYKF